MASLVLDTEVATFIEGVRLPADGDKVAQLLAWADGVLASWLRWPTPSGGRGPTLCEDTYVDYLNGPVLDDYRTLRLRMRPVTGITEVADDPDWDYDGNVVNAANYVPDLQRGRVILARGSSHAWSNDHRAIRVTYTAGFPTASPPYHVQQALLLLIRNQWQFKRVPGLPNAAELDTPARFITDDVRELMSEHGLWETACA